jgi:transcriptional regulator with XRE-family HTH domain
MARRQPGKQQAITPAGQPRIGTALRALLDERFLTHAELAQAIGVHEQNISRWVRNETGPQKKRVRQIAEYFGVEPASLIEDDGDRAAA